MTRHELLQKNIGHILTVRVALPHGALMTVKGTLEYGDYGDAYSIHTGYDASVFFGEDDTLDIIGGDFYLS